MKRKFELPEFEIIMFGQDVITDSANAVFDAVGREDIVVPGIGFWD